MYVPLGIFTDSSVARLERDGNATDGDQASLLRENGEQSASRLNRRGKHD